MAVSSDARRLVANKAAALWPNDPRSQRYFEALAQRESSFNPAAYAPDGDSYGLFQFGPEMRRAYGMDMNSPAEVQVDAGGDYIKSLWDKHHGNWDNVLAEHNLGAPRFNRYIAGGTDPAIERFRNSHLPAIEAIAGDTPMSDPTAPVPGAVAQQATDPMAQFQALLASLPPEVQQQLMQMIAASAGGGGLGMGQSPQVTQPIQPTQDPRMLAALLGGAPRGGPLTDPAATIHSLYPSTNQPGGPQSGYLQVLGGSFAPGYDSNMRALSTAALIQNALTGFMDARRQQQGGQ